ncbi:MalY/PatB family protein [Microbacterium sp.]|uniref:MalY/PatB family protein n=1 Tax=Microbacterium sp. TaxID=51671 RepID=UPI0039E43181
MTAVPLEALPLETLRRRSSSKWRTYPDDVLPLFVAETDFPLAEAIRTRLADAVEIGDTGYTPGDPGIRDAYVGFAARRFGWTVDPRRIVTTADVMMGVVELLRATTSPGDRVVITPPVYPPFWICIDEAGGVAEEVPLLDDGQTWRLDLAGIEASLADGARAVLLCNPHNPTGSLHDGQTLTALAELADRYGAIVISDEIHAPLAAPGAGFTPFLAAGPAAERVGFAVTSASKAFNLAGLKCALMIAAGDERAADLTGLPREVAWRTGLFGALAGIAAFEPESDGWLDALLARLAENRRLLGELLAEHLPQAVYRAPDVGFLAWVDLSAYGWGADPAATILRECRVAFHHGPEFGTGGAGHVRINVGCAPEVLTDAVQRVAAFAAS